jgi:hypothetical protein
MMANRLAYAGQPQYFVTDRIGIEHLGPVLAEKPRNLALPRRNTAEQADDFHGSGYSERNTEQQAEDYA